MREGERVSSFLLVRPLLLPLYYLLLTVLYDQSSHQSQTTEAGGVVLQCLNYFLFSGDSSADLVPLHRLWPVSGESQLSSDYRSSQTCRERQTSGHIRHTDSDHAGPYRPCLPPQD